MYSFEYLFVKILRKILNPPAINHSLVDKNAKCGIGCNVSWSKIGRYSYLGEYTSLSYVEVGNFTCISSGCSIGGGNHPLYWVSMSPVFQDINVGLLKKKFEYLPFSPHETTYIGNDVWIGASCNIKSGVTISDGAVIGMGSVLTHDVGPYEIWGGNPARLIRKRFDDQIIEQLEQIKWWYWDDDKIKQFSEYFDNIKTFLETQQ